MDKLDNNPDVKQWYIVYELDGRRNRQHGGPYTPQKARELKQTLEKQLGNENRAANNIPDDAVDVFLSPGRKRVGKKW